MIERYTLPEMKAIWSDENRYRKWLVVELEVCSHLAKTRVIPKQQGSELKLKLEKLIRKGIDVSKIHEHEKVLKHDLIAFTTTVAESVGPLSRWVHFGLTSSDVIDSAQALVMLEANEILMSGLEKLKKELIKKANQTKNLPTIGRSHGINAEPTAFGLKFLGFYAECERAITRLKAAHGSLSYGKLSGAVGVNAHFSPREESQMLKNIGLKRETVSTQVVPRDRHAEWMNAIALTGATLERMAIEFRHLQRSEVSEVIEGFTKGQKGSSAMPHKRNPISAENITGCARLLRSYAQASLENVALWHERDISHSSVERVILPDATILLDYSLNRMTKLVLGLEIDRKQVEKNLKSAGTVSFSGHFLLALVRKGAAREDAYYWVQSCAHESLKTGKPMTRFLEKHAEIKKYLKPSEIKTLGSLKYQLRHVGDIFSLCK
ncbi:MAG: adenylosuccinate lyase [Xanthomonadaceae bacterium]|nr:adenylosuccinate lyase [Xanthomonadaceae bacterium]